MSNQQVFDRNKSSLSKLKCFFSAKTCIIQKNVVPLRTFCYDVWQDVALWAAL